MNVRCRTFNISWNTYFLKYLCKTLSHGWHLIDSCIDLFSKYLTCPNVYAFILSTLLIALMGFRRLGAALYSKTAHEWSQSQPCNVPHVWYVIPQWWPLDSRGLKWWLMLTWHRVICSSIIGSHTKQTAVGKLKKIQDFLQIYSLHSSCMLPLDLSSFIRFPNWKKTGQQPHQRRVELHEMHNLNPYSMQ